MACLLSSLSYISMALVFIATLEYARGTGYHHEDRPAAVRVETFRSRKVLELRSSALVENRRDVSAVPKEATHAATVPSKEKKSIDNNVEDVFHTDYIPVALHPPHSHTQPHA